MSKSSGKPKVAAVRPQGPPPHLHTKDDPRVFVFGSNRRGRHGAGAADYAATDLGARQGIGEGITGRTYALPTCSSPGVPLTLGEVSVHVHRFLSLARLMPETRFFVSEVGCGLAGFEAKDIAPLFRDAPMNCDLPPKWRESSDDPEVVAARPKPKTPAGSVAR